MAMKFDSIEEVKGYLTQVKPLAMSIMYLRSKRKEVEETLKVTASYSERVQSGSVGSSVEEYAIKLAELKQEIIQGEAERQELIRDIEATIDRFVPRERVFHNRTAVVLKMKYLNGMTNSAVAKRIGLSLEQVKRILNKGYEQLLQNAIE